MKITYLSHAAFLIETAGHKILIDPFLTHNPLAPCGPGDITADFILVSHAHGDHIGDAIPIAQRCNAPIVALSDLAAWFRTKGVTTIPVYPGTVFDMPFGRLRITPSVHGNTLTDGSAVTIMGQPAGFVIYSEGKTLYHPGDTGITAELRLIGELAAPLDVALLPIGGTYTMNIDDALKAIEMLNPRLTLPMHYNTFDNIPADPGVFVARAAANGRSARVIAIGETIAV